MMQLIHDLWFKRRDLISDGFDESLEYISKIIPFKIHEIPTGTECWTWRVPNKWSVEEAFIEDLNGHRLLDVKEHPLHVMSYSSPINRIVTRKELFKHLRSQPDRPAAIPFFPLHYRKNWGFCIQHNRLKEFTKDKYRICINSRFESGTLKVGDFTVPGKMSEKTIVIMAHLCHPTMVEDDLTGVAVLVEIAKWMKKRSPHYTHEFLLVPETIGSIAYLSQNENIIPKLKYGIFLEMLSNKNSLALQLTRQGDTQLDRIAQRVMESKIKFFREGPFGRVIGNDEKVLNGPGVNVPTISISRFRYPEYHTSDDNPSIIVEKNLEESRDLVIEILKILDNNYRPKRTFKGPPFLTKFGLWVDWRINRRLSQNIQLLMLKLEGDKSIFDIAEELEMKFNDVLKFVNKLFDNNLVERIW